ncbi:hypothetical protein [Erysipelothrix rhusiopathiae]|uniref:hypothetical protein n=1 Tax=Erysipelothrix rhusiopathiae TaxID=1648 RepID=UPI0039EBBFEC
MKNNTRRILHVLLKILLFILAILPALLLIWFLYYKNILFAKNIIDAILSFVGVVLASKGFWILVIAYFVWFGLFFLVNQLVKKTGKKKVGGIIYETKNRKRVP